MWSTSIWLYASFTQVDSLKGGLTACLDQLIDPGDGMITQRKGLFFGLLIFP